MKPCQQQKDGPKQNEPTNILKEVNRLSKNSNFAARMFKGLLAEGKDKA